MQRETILALIGAALAVVLDVVLSPNLMVFSATPNFSIAYVVVLSLLVRGNVTYVIAFALGMVADLLAFGPVGSLALFLLVASIIGGRVSKAFDDGSLGGALIMVAGLTLLVELLHAAVTIALTSGVSAVDGIVYLALPCSLFDMVLGLVLYPLMLHLFVSKRATMGSEPPSAGLH